MGVTIDDVEPLVNRYYSSNDPLVIAKPKSPFYNLVPKKTNCVGQFRLPTIFGDGGGASSTFATAQSNSSSTSQASFDLSSGNMDNDFAVAQVDNKTILATESKGAIANILTLQGDAKLRKLMRRAQIGLYKGTRTKELARVSSVSTTSLVLAYNWQARRFMKGDKVVINDGSANDPTDALRGSGASVEVIAVDASNATLTAAANWTATIAGITAGDYVFLEGDWSATDIGYAGLPMWLPDTAPGATAFFSVDRSEDTERLGGQRVDASASGSIREAIIEGASALFDNTQGDATLTDISLPTDKFKTLQMELDSANEIIRDGEDAKFGFRFITASFGQYKARVWPDPENLPDVSSPTTYHAYLLDMSTWLLCSLGDVPHIDTLDGNKMLRQNTNAGIELRVESYAQLGCKAPGHNCSVILP